VLRRRIAERGITDVWAGRGRIGRTEEEIKRDKTRLRGPRPSLSAVSASARRLKLRWRGSAAFANAAASRSLAEKSSSRPARHISLSLSLSFCIPLSHVRFRVLNRGGRRTLTQPFPPCTQPVPLEYNGTNVGPAARSALNELALVVSTDPLLICAREGSWLRDHRSRRIDVTIGGEQALFVEEEEY